MRELWNHSASIAKKTRGTYLFSSKGFTGDIVKYDQERRQLIVDFKKSMSTIIQFLRSEKSVESQADEVAIVDIFHPMKEGIVETKVGRITLSSVSLVCDSILASGPSSRTIA